MVQTQQSASKGTIGRLEGKEKREADGKPIITGIAISMENYPRFRMRKRLWSTGETSARNEYEIHKSKVPKDPKSQMELLSDTVRESLSM